MAILHPALSTIPSLGVKNTGTRRERDVLYLLQKGLPDTYAVFHSVNWSNFHKGIQNFGELDAVVLSPQGHLMIVEVKSGAVNFSKNGLTKDYVTHAGTAVAKDIGRQVHRQTSAVRSSLEAANLGQARLFHVLVLADYIVKHGTIGYPREHIVDATELDGVAAWVLRVLSGLSDNESNVARLQNFLSDHFLLQPDVAGHNHRVRAANIVLAEGLATWLPRISHSSGVFQIQGTAGSGKSQLALTLLRSAEQGPRPLKSMYVCFNRPLSDAMARLAPTRAQLNTFHGFCVDFARRTGHEPDFSTPGVFDALVQQFSQAEVPDAACVDLLIIDEAQDFDPTWIQALLNRLAVGGRAYMLSDANQDLYAREEFDIPDAVQVRCMDNFRSPHRIVQTINQLGLCQDRVRACSAAEGETPGFHTYPVQTEPRLAKKVNTAQHCLNTCLSDLWRQGVVPDDVVVLSFAGIKQSAVLQAGQSASPFVRDHALRVFTGQYDSAGNEVWTQGDLKAESIYRFKGQSAPVVVLCEVDFPAITDKVLHKLFVGFTRAQLRLEVVLSEQAATLLLARGE